MTRVYIVDDDYAVRNALKLLLRTAELDAEAFPSGDAFLENADLTQHCCVLLDIRMPGMTGTALHDELLRRGVRVPVIFITGHGDIPMAVEAMRKGAYDFIVKPIDPLESLVNLLQRAIEHASLVASNRALRRSLEERARFSDMVGSSEAMREMFNVISAVADTDVGHQAARPSPQAISV